MSGKSSFHGDSRKAGAVLLAAAAMLLPAALFFGSCCKHASVLLASML